MLCARFSERERQKQMAILEGDCFQVNQLELFSDNQVVNLVEHVKCSDNFIFLQQITIQNEFN